MVATSRWFVPKYCMIRILEFPQENSGETDVFS